MRPCWGNALDKDAIFKTDVGRFVPIIYLKFMICRPKSKWTITLDTRYEYPWYNKGKLDTLSVIY